jgi:hypothetical protein
MLNSTVQSGSGSAKTCYDPSSGSYENCGSGHWLCQSENNGTTVTGRCAGASPPNAASSTLCNQPKCNKVTYGGCWDASNAKLAAMVDNAYFCKTLVATGVGTEETTCTPDANTLCCAITSTYQCNRPVKCVVPSTGSPETCDTSGASKDYMCGVKKSDGTGGCYALADYTSVTASDYVFFLSWKLQCWDPSLGKSDGPCGDSVYQCYTNLATGKGGCQSGTSPAAFYYCTPSTGETAGCNNYGPSSVALTNSSSTLSGSGWTCFNPSNPGTPDSCTANEFLCETTDLGVGKCATNPAVTSFSCGTGSMCNKIEKCWNKATPGANITCANPLTMACQTDYSSPTTVTCATSCTNAETPSRTRCCFWTNCNKVTKAGCWNPASAQLAPLVYGALYCKTSPNFGLTAEATTCQPSSNMLCCSINSDKPCNKVTRCNNKGTYVNCDTSAINKDVACAVIIFCSTTQ